MEQTTMTDVERLNEYNRNLKYRKAIKSLEQRITKLEQQIKKLTDKKSNNKEIKNG